MWAKGDRDQASYLIAAYNVSLRVREYLKALVVQEETLICPAAATRCQTQNNGLKSPGNTSAVTAASKSDNSRNNTWELANVYSKTVPRCDF